MAQPEPRVRLQLHRLGVRLERLRVLAQVPEAVPAVAPPEPLVPGVHRSLRALEDLERLRRAALVDQPDRVVARVDALEILGEKGRGDTGKEESGSHGEPTA